MFVRTYLISSLLLCVCVCVCDAQILSTWWRIIRPVYHVPPLKVYYPSHDMKGIIVYGLYQSIPNIRKRRFNHKRPRMTTTPAAETNKVYSRPQTLTNVNAFTIVTPPPHDRYAYRSTVECSNPILLWLCACEIRNWLRMRMQLDFNLLFFKNGTMYDNDYVYAPMCVWCTNLVE